MSSSLLIRLFSVIVAVSLVAACDDPPKRTVVVDLDEIKKKNENPLDGIIVTDENSDAKKDPEGSPDKPPAPKKIEPGDPQATSEEDPPAAKPVAPVEEPYVAKRLKVNDKPFGDKLIDSYLKELEDLVNQYEEKVNAIKKGQDTTAIELAMKKRAEAFNAKGTAVREATNKLTPKEGTRFNLLVRVKYARMEALAQEAAAAEKDKPSGE